MALKKICPKCGTKVSPIWKTWTQHAEFHNWLDEQIRKILSGAYGNKIDED